jgi:hypothetical protein
MSAHDAQDSPRKQGLKPFTAAWLEYDDPDLKLEPRYA